MANDKRLQRQRFRLWQQDPRCYYCRVITILPESLSLPRARNGGLKVYPNNLATLEHLRSRLHPKRLEPNPTYTEQRHVLACRKCNQETCRRDELLAGIDELRRKSGSYPKFS